MAVQREPGGGGGEALCFPLWARRLGLDSL